MKLIISTDSTADLSDELYQKFNIQVTPLEIFVGDKLYKDGVDITPEDIYRAVEEKKIVPKSSAINEEEYAEYFKKWTDGGNAVIHISISSKLSVSHNNAVKASKNFQNVYVVDSKSLSTGTGLLVLRARELEAKGMEVKEIFEELEKTVEKVQCSFVLDDLKYMHKGGRCSGFKLFGANLLSIHPMLQLQKDGCMTAPKTFRGKYPNVVKVYTDYILKTYPNADKSMVFVTHTAMQTKDIENQIEADLKEAGFETVYNTTAGSTITTHCGRNTIGILFINK